MISIRPLASSSKANAYIVDNGVLKIQIEAGLTFRQQRPLSQPLDSGVVLISHEHLDHSRGVRAFLESGVECYMSRGTAEAIGVEWHHKTLIVDRKFPRFVNLAPSWRCLSFDLVHDANEPLGFVLSSFTGPNDPENLLFATDTALIPYRFGGLTHMMIECNYQHNILMERLTAEEISVSQYRRLFQAHMSLETLIRYLKNTDCSHLKELWLIHVSDKNINENKMLESLEGIVHCPIFIA